MADFYLYFSAFLPHWWPFVTAGGLLGFDAFCQRYWQWAKHQLDRIRPRRRRQIEYGFLLLAVFYAGYAAWSDEHSKHITEYPAHGRALTSDQKQRLRETLKLDSTEHYSFEVNAVPSCEECELFAEDIRDFINTIPGWTASGAPLIFSDPNWVYGTWLISRADEKNIEPVKKLNRAFHDAGVPLAPATEDFRKGNFVIVIGRQKL